MSNILTPQEAADMLRLDSADNYPQFNILLPAIDDFIQSATGRDWTADAAIDPTAKVLASVLLTKWFDDPGMIGKADDTGTVTLIDQLHAKALGMEAAEV